MKILLVCSLIFLAARFALFGQSARAADANASAATSQDKDKITLKSFCLLPTGKVVAMFRNDSGKPVNAFRGTWSLFNDFNEVSRSGDILFTSDTLVIGDQTPRSGYTLPPNGIIYLLDDGKQKVAMVGRLASESFGNLDAVPQKHSKVVITNVVFAQSDRQTAREQTSTQSPSDAGHRRSDNASADTAVITERVNSFYEKYQTPKFQDVEAALRAEYLTERFQRERAEEDKHPEEMDGDSYTLSDGGWDVGAIRVIDVQVQGARAEASVSRGGDNHNMKVSVVKERGKWLIDRVHFARGP